MTMKNAFVLVTFFITCIAYTKNIENKTFGVSKRLTNDNLFELSSPPNSSSVRLNFDHETRKRSFKKRRRRCKRFIESYQRVPTFQRGYNGQHQLSSVYVPPRYVVASPYVPTRCRTYCRVCPMPSCPRRCPGLYFPTRITPTIKTTTRPTPRTRSTPRTKACTCDPDGSKFPMCNDKTGECVCNPHHAGKTCDTCEDGYWKQHKKCKECNCNQHGTLKNTHCDKETGRCKCKSGVTGTFCNSCLPDHYGTVKTGCKKCDPCDKKGHICDPTNGKCVCPPLTTGNLCERCQENAWGYEPNIGCKECNCSTMGSSNLQCDQTKGKCTCKIGYEGEKCNNCSYGYYGYSDCRKCNCDPTGTAEGECKIGLCRCGDDSSCRCKENVQGKNCDKCKKNNYGLSKENPKGCTNCFCFGRSNKCEDAKYHWSKSTRFERKNDDNIQVAEDELMLPKSFMGDLTSSYGGYLVVEVARGSFDVFIEGNAVQLRSLNNNKELHLIETGNWRVVTRNPDFPINCIDNLTRACFMVVLQKVTSFLVKANNRIDEVLLDKAENEESTYPITHAIEKCQCPKEYTGLSCQNPNNGYYRYFPRDMSSTWINLVIGIAKECECGGHSRECDPETGFCKNCGDHTTGNHCENCDIGFYKDKNNNCAPCLCPSADQNNAKSCFPTGEGFKCECKKGYKGNFCEDCDRKFYKPQNSTVCEPCRCNRHGIVQGDPGNCNQFGKCQCRQGFAGDKCDQCVEERKYIKNGMCAECDECTMKLFDEIDKMKQDIEGIFDSFKNGIGPPWKKLTDNIEHLDGLSNKYSIMKEKVDEVLESSYLEDYKAWVIKMEKKLDENNILAENNVAKTDKLYENSSRLLEETGKLGKKLINLIDGLNVFGTKHIDLKEALKGARHTLEEIEKASKKFQTYSNKTFSFCTRISERANNLYSPPPNFSENALEDLKKNLQDLIDIVSYADNLSKLADAKNTENSKRIEKLKEKIEILKSKDRNVENSVGEIMEKSNAIEDMMGKLQTVYGDLKNMSEFEEFKELGGRVKRQMKDIPEIEELYSRAIEHVQELENKVNHYQSLFNFTKDEWKKINASGAYEAIINGIKEAESSVKLSKKIMKNAIKLISPESTDSLDVKSNLAHAYSDRLKQRINNLKDLSKNLGEIQNKLVKLKYGILENGKSNNDLTQILHKIDSEIISQSELVEDVEEAMKNASQVSEDMRHIEKQLEDMNFDKQFVLSKKYQKYFELTMPEEITDFTARLMTTRKKLQDLNILPNKVGADKNREAMNRLNELKNNMKSLMNTIQQAKQHVDVIDVAMNLTNCKMAYELSNSQLFESLTITFKCRNCALFKWNKASGEVLSLIVENKMPKILVENKEIVIPNGDARERTISLQKVGSLLRVQLDEIESSVRVTGMSVINKEDVLEIGSLDKPVIDSYVYKVLLNEANFGLWKFKNTSGLCTGQKRETSSDDNFKNSFFNGKGYREYGINRSLSPRASALKFFFNTFDENSTIYVAEHNKSCSYIALFLENGRVKLKMKHSNGQNVLLTSKIKVNDAFRHEVEIGLSHSSRRQIYSLVVDEEKPMITTEHLDPKYVFKIKESKHYLGGVPPTFNRTCVPIKTTSLLGFLGQTSQKDKLTNETISYGIIKTSEDALNFNHAWIHQNGFMRVESAKEKINSLSFILRPITQDGLIIKFNEINNISLSQSNLVVNGVKYEGVDLVMNDYNSIEVKMSRGKKTLTVNGRALDFKEHVKMSVDSVLIGGAKDGVCGGIRDIVINNKILSFNATSVKVFFNVEIGREKPLPKNNINVRSLTMSNLTNSMQNTERCVEFDVPDILADAVKFGDKPNGYTHIKTNFWKSNYTLQFDFRTLYPNGVIFISSNKKMNYIFLELKDGQLRLNIKGKKKKVKSLPIASNRKLNDGDWHNLRITKKSKKLSVVLDKQLKPSRINARIIPRDEIYFGGVPIDSKFMLLNDLRDKMHPFRGCIKALKFNNEQKLLFKNDKDVVHSNVTQCFANKEEGAYFAGNSFAIYRDDFQVSEMLELSFEFRTSEQNGILLSVSNHGDYPALSVELQNGAIVMSVNVGNGVVSNVTNNLDSDFSLCNNRWHNVTALYSTSELTVNVDGIRKSWVQSDVNSTVEDIEAPLYIGGLPDDAPIGTLTSLTNFKGCLRKLKIENELLDWSDMRQLNNVLLNSCPTDRS